MNSFVQRNARSWCVIALLGLLLCGGLRAQTYSTYTFSSHSQPYTELPNPGTITNSWSGGQFLLSLGNRKFTFFGHEVDFSKSTKNYLGLLANGELIIVSDTTQFTLPVYLAGFRSKDATSSITHGIYEITDMADTAYIIQWKNAGFLEGDTANYANFQIWIYQKSGVIEYRYGPSRVVGTEPFNGAPGPSIGVVISDPNITDWYRSIFVVGPTTNPKAGIDSIFHPMQGAPLNGAIYRFTPTAAASVPALEEGIDLRVFPSVTRDVVIVEIAEDAWSAGASAVVRDILGRQVIEAALTERSSTIDLSGLSSGTYWIEVITRHGRRATMVQKQ